jgi:four helix bundle protein
MQDFKQLNVWQKSHSMALLVYQATRKFPMEERFGLMSQMRRAATSIPANIAEGCGRSGKAELKQFLYISMGSACELEYFLLLAADLRILSSPECHKLGTGICEIKRMLAGLIDRLNSPAQRTSPSK